MGAKAGGPTGEESVGGPAEIERSADFLSGGSGVRTGPIAAGGSGAEDPAEAPRTGAAKEKVSYGFKLGCVSLAGFLIVNWAAAMAVGGAAPAVIRAAAGLRARSAARLLWMLRMAPVAALGVPSYLRFEPEGDGEPVGPACLLAALVAIAAVLHALIRSALAVRRSRRAAGLR